jgi:signal peptidase I
VDQEGADEEGEDAGDARPRRRFGGARFWRVLIRLIIVFAFIAGAALLLRTWVVQPYYIPSASMEPTLHGCSNCNDDHVLVDKVSYRAHGVRVGDIVVFSRPKGVQVPDKVLIKRVIALAGDRISATRGQIFVNGLAIEEPYLNKDHSCYARSPDENFKARTVPDKDVFVMGDNRCNSTDSRDFGAIPTSSIVGRAFAIIWPFHRIGGL